MATVETHVIGVGTTDPAGYTTIAAWLAACPTNLVTADLIWRGELMNQGFAAATKTGITADATRYVELTTAAGCSFLDNADVRTNPLRFNKSAGAYIEGTAAYTAALNISALYTRISKLQVNHTSGYSNDVLSLGSYSRVSACICEGRKIPLRIASAGIVENSFFLQRYTAALAVAVLPSATIVNSTFVAGAFTSPYAISGNYGVGSIKNCYFGNCTLTTATGTSATTWTKSNNASSVVIDGCVTAPLSTATFEDVTYGTHDFRLAAGSALIDAGVADANYGLTDISGTARPVGTAFDIGAWEYAAESSDITVSLGWQNYAVTQGALAASVVSNISLTLAGQSYALTQGAPLRALTKGLSGQTYALTPGSISAVVGTSVTLTLSGQAYAITPGVVSIGQSKALVNQAYAHAAGALGASVGSNVNITLAGQGYAVTQGSVAIARSISLAGQQYALAPGLLVASIGGNVTLTLGALSYTTSQGNLGRTLDIGLAGRIYTLAQGIVAPAAGRPLTGQLVSFTQGALEPSGASYFISLAGQSYLLEQGLLTAVGGDLARTVPPILVTLYAIFGELVGHAPAAGGAQRIEKAIYSRPGSTLYGGDVMVVDHSLRYPTAAFSPVVRGDRFVVGGALINGVLAGGETFFAREPAQTILDGAESVVTLGRV